jgi:hypothetical protein
LRLIHAGRLLTDSTQLASWLSTLEERQQRAAEKDKEGADSSIAPTVPGPSSVVPWLLHCSVGPPLSEGEEDDDAQAQVRRRSSHFSILFLLTTLVGPASWLHQEAQIKPLRGFDRLASAGFSEDDILNIRRQFHSRSVADYLSTAEFPTEEECASASSRSTYSPTKPHYHRPNPLVDEEHARALEEQWIDGLGGGGSAGGGSAESDSRARAVLNGIIIGFFFPLLPFFFLRAPKPAAFWESGHALETPESTVFSYAPLLPSLDVFGCLRAVQTTHADGPCRGFYSERYFWLVAVPLGHILSDSSSLTICNFLPLAMDSNSFTLILFNAIIARLSAPTSGLSYSSRTFK